MANDIKVQDIIAREAQYHLKNELVLGNLVSREHEAEFDQTPNGYKVGDTVRVKRPARCREIQAESRGPAEPRSRQGLAGRAWLRGAGKAVRFLAKAPRGCGYSSAEPLRPAHSPLRTSFRQGPPPAHRPKRKASVF